MNTANPYRTVGSPIKQPDAEPRPELAYTQQDHGNAGRASAGVLLRFLAAAVGAAFTAMFSQEGALLALGLGAVWMWHTWSEGRRPRGLVLRVAGGELTVSPAQGGAAVFALALEELGDVALESKTISKVMAGTEMTGILRVMNSRVGPEQDVARIVLASRDSEAAYALTTEYLTRMESEAWMGRIRVFLRAQGWVPADEREEKPRARKRRAKAVGSVAHANARLDVRTLP